MASNTLWIKLNNTYDGSGLKFNKVDVAQFNSTDCVSFSDLLGFVTSLHVNGS